MVIKKDNGKGPKKPASNKARQELTARPLLKKTKGPVDVLEKDNPPKDSNKFPNRYCELVYSRMIERNYHPEPLLVLPAHLSPIVMPHIDRRHWRFLLRQPMEANLSWVVEFYSNFHSPHLTSIFVRRKQVSVTVETIREVLGIEPSTDAYDAYQEVLATCVDRAFDWSAILRIIASPDACWIRGTIKKRPKGLDARYLTQEATAWAQILAHYVLPSTHGSSITAELALLIWCILTKKPVDVPCAIRQSMGRIHAKGNLPFPALVTALVAKAGVNRETKDRRTSIPVDGDIIPTKRCLKPPEVTKDIELPTPTGHATTSSTSQKSAAQRLEDLHNKLDRYERHNQRRYAHVKRLLSVITPPMEEPDISTSTATSSGDSNGIGDVAHSELNHPARLTSSTEDRAKF